jgi:DNA-binding transcriptional LysR family regulator
MELRDLRVLVAVIDEGGFTRAADCLHLVQSSVSDAVQRLEREFGLRLVERDRHGVRPTPAGERLLVWAKVLLNSASRATEELSGFRGFAGGTLRIGFLSSLVPVVLPRLLAETHARFPDLEVRIEEGLATALVDRLVTCDLDLVVLFLPTPRKEGLSFVEVSPMPFSVVVPNSHWLAGKTSISLPDLADEHWVTFPPHNPGRLWLEDACHRAGFSPTVSATIETYAQQRIFVEAGYGVAVVPYGNAPWWHPLHAIPLDMPLPDFRAGYVCNTRQPYRSLEVITKLVHETLADAGLPATAARLAQSRAS